MKIVYPHIPKCAGASVRSQLEGRGDAYFDYYNHPTWSCQEDRVEGARRQAQLQARLRAADSWLVFGHFALEAYREFPYDLQVIMVRPPLERAVSQYHFIKHKMPDSEAARRRHHEVSLIKDGRMAIEEFCQLEHIRHFYSRYYLRGLVLDERSLAISTQDLGAGFAKLARATGISLDPHIRANTTDYAGDFGHLRSVFEEDQELYDTLFW